MTDNMKLWGKVCETDPEYTKSVSFGRSFTAIDPMYQIKCATERFGPAGEGWGWEVRQIQHLQNDSVAILVRLWHGTRDNFIEQWGQNGLYTDNKKTKDDQDCMKKATTDAVTKCLSCLGFNADVFLGKFEDNKYVAAMRQKHAAVERAWIKESVKKIEAMDCYERLTTWLKDPGTADNLAKLSQAQSEYMDGKIKIATERLHQSPIPQEQPQTQANGQGASDHDADSKNRSQ